MNGDATLRGKQGSDKTRQGRTPTADFIKNSPLCERLGVCYDS